jgi:hypothetical protein
MVVRRSVAFVAVTFLVIATKYNVSSTSSSPSHRSINSPSASPSQLPSAVSNNLPETTIIGVDESLLVKENNVSSSSSSEFFHPQELSERGANDDNDNTINYHPSQQQLSQTATPLSSSSLAFLYELYEHEIFNPKSNTWSSRRFTQSATTGGGGRDSTSLDPQSCTPPRNYVFDGEWKIDMTSDTRDGFGWEYYVGKYDGLGRRRRRWVRSLVRIRGSSNGSASSLENASASSARKKSMKQSSGSAKKKKSIITRGIIQQQQKKSISLLRVLRDQYNFKGFGWSINKSFIHAKAFGTTFRLPLSANFDGYDRYFAAPYISASTYFGYPWVVVALLNASLPVEAIRWMIGGVIWKLQWGVAVISALIRGVAEFVIWVVLWPWRLWMATFQLMGIVSTGRRSVIKKQDEDMTTKSSNTDIARDRDGTKRVMESDHEMNVSIETHIEIKDKGEMSATTAAAAAAVIDSPRGGASNIAPLSFFARKHLTMFGNEIPTFHRTTSLAYSSTIQERIGVAVSWRVSKQRGYEYRCNLFFTCMPTRLFWEQVDEERKKHVESVHRIVSSWKDVSDQSSTRSIGNTEIDKIEEKDTSRLESKSTSNTRSKSQSMASALTTFLNDHSSTVGISGGWPMPSPPHFAFNLVLSMSGFYLGWILAYIRSIFVLPLPKTLHQQSNDDELSPITSTLSPVSEKLVSSALKNKLPLEEEEEEGTEETDEEEFITNSS